MYVCHRQLASGQCVPFEQCKRKSCALLGRQCSVMAKLVNSVIILPGFKSYLCLYDQGQVTQSLYTPHILESPSINKTKNSTYFIGCYNC